MKKKILLMLLVLAGVFLFVQLGKNSPIERIRRKANEIANDKVVQKILDDFGTIKERTKEYMMFREAMKQKNPLFGEKELLKRYVLYTLLSEKAKDFGLTLTPEEMENASRQAQSFFMFGESSEEEPESAMDLVEDGFGYAVEDWVSAIDGFNRNYLLIEKLEEFLKEAYTGVDFESYFEEYKEKLFGLWQEKGGESDSNRTGK